MLANKNEMRKFGEHGPLKLLTYPLRDKNKFFFLVNLVFLDIEQFFYML